ncbi:2-dehydropantoate 2-reductase [Parendozoicomonas sp. Alg238-R29]|uniref:ketopantoate reductase family protein n=1 Tax=Parendozoicomonas sp. Alg238-R29 TaxID=2993446 RepID=UPI00248F28D0|nr:2-dehydropantoate 2-reductase [Parendozoicomonas sp. Alg238-R29]
MTVAAYPHWYILGAGAIGCLWGGQLFRSDIPSTFLVRPERLNNNTPSPVLCITENQQRTEFPIDIQSIATEVSIQNLIITTKAGDALPALNAIADNLTSDATILLLQNGMGSQQQIAELFPQYAVYAGSTTDGAWLESFLNIHRAGRGKTWLGPLNPRAKEFGHYSAINSLTKITDIDVTFVDNITEKLQEKLAINSAINGLAVLHDCPNGSLLEGALQKQVQNLCTETAQILSADSYTITAERLLETVNHVLKVTAENINSSLQDVRNNRTTELNWINGYLLTRAQKHGIAAPAHKQLIQALADKDIH